MPFAKINGRELHYTDHAPSISTSTTGSSEPLTLVFAHGLGSTQNYFGAALPSLHQYRCVTFDNYGAGRSSFIPDQYPETSVGSIAEDVLALMDHLSIRRVVVVGYSMSGMVVTTLASGPKADRVIAGVCIGPVHPTPASAEIFQKRVATVKDGGMETMANAIPSAATGPNATALQKSFIREMLLAQNPEGYCANCRAIETAKPPDYAGVQCPILIIAGEVDKSAPMEGCKHIYDHLSTTDKKFEVLDKVGHWLCVEDGERVGKLIKDFCEGLKQ